MFIALEVIYKKRIMIMMFVYFDHVGLTLPLLGPFYMVPDLHGHNIKLDSFKMSVALEFMIILQDVVTTYHRKCGKSK